MKKNLLVIVIIMVLLAVMLSGCDGDDDNVNVYKLGFTVSNKTNSGINVFYSFNTDDFEWFESNTEPVYIQIDDEKMIVFEENPSEDYHVIEYEVTIEYPNTSISKTYENYVGNRFVSGFNIGFNNVINGIFKVTGNIDNNEIIIDII